MLSVVKRLKTKVQHICFSENVISDLQYFLAWLTLKVDPAPESTTFFVK
jgi:hypothetical protein